MVENGVLLRPVAVIDRTKAWDELMEIVHEPKGLDPKLSDDELMEQVVEGIHQARQA